MSRWRIRRPRAREWACDSETVFVNDVQTCEWRNRLTNDNILHNLQELRYVFEIVQRSAYLFEHHSIVDVPLHRLFIVGDLSRGKLVDPIDGGKVGVIERLLEMVPRIQITAAKKGGHVRYGLWGRRSVDPIQPLRRFHRVDWKRIGDELRKDICLAIVRVTIGVEAGLIQQLIDAHFGQLRGCGQDPPRNAVSTQR